MTVLREIVAIIGIAAVVYGVYQVYPPAAWIVGGVAFVWFAMPDGRR